jgi:hypothetical protein
LKNARERMDILAAYREVGSYRGAAAICGTTHKTVRRVVQAQLSTAAGPRPRGHNFDAVTDLVADKVAKHVGADLGEAAAASGAGGRLCRVGAELPPAGGRAEAGVAP